MSEKDYFHINANTRQITVPEAFKRNGLGVAGDKIAETVYFKINRYFDATDLNTTKIYIVWKQNGNNQDGIATEWVRDIETFDDYLVFGWVLGGDMTSASGQLDFSIRFVKTDPKSGVVTYSLNTQTAHALINNTLDLPGDTPDDSLNNILASSFIDTTTKTDSEIEVFKFVYNFDNLIDASNLNGDVISADLIKGEDNKYRLEFLVSTYIDRDANANYKLYKQLGDTIDINNTDKEHYINMTYSYIPVSAEEKTPKNDRKYYKKIENSNPEQYEYVFINSTGEIPKDFPSAYYEQYGQYLLEIDPSEKNVPLPAVCGDSISGLYYGVAIGELNGTNSSPLPSSRKVQILAPEKATFKDIPLENKGVQVNSNIDVTDNIILPNKNIETYIWSCKKFGETDFSEIKTIEGSLEERAKAELTPTEEGIYQLKVKTSRNLDSKIADNILTFYVTEIPTNDAVIITSPTSDVKYSKGSNGVYLEIQATYEQPNAIANYELKYQWQKFNEELEDYEDIIQNGNNSDYLANTIGKYRCKLIPVYNTLQSQEPIFSPVFTVIE